MSRLIYADALIADVTERYCKDCNKRKGMKNGKLRTIYEIGEAPCRACDVDDMKDELENAPTVDAVPVVRCKDCENSKPWYRDKSRCFLWDEVGIDVFNDGFCSYGIERKNTE